MFPATMQNDEQIKRNATKGAAIKLAGFTSGIDALPEDIKEKLDLMLRCKYSPQRILSELSQRFPDVNLPSKSALYNYRKRFFEQSIVSATPVVRAEQEFDVEKVKLKSAVIWHIKRFIAVDLQVLRDRWYKAMEKDRATGLLSKETKEASKTYLQAIKISMDTMPRLNINIDLVEEQQKPIPATYEEAQKVIEKETPQETLDRILIKRAPIMFARMGKKITISDM
jgi:hypothetical protein